MTRPSYGPIGYWPSKPIAYNSITNKKSKSKKGLVTMSLPEFHQMVEAKQANKKTKRRRAQRRIGNKTEAGALAAVLDPNTSTVKPTKYTLSKVNPFLPECNGVKVPDNFTYPTATAILRNVYGISTNATGFGVKLFTPNLANNAYDCNSISAAGAITWAGGVSRAAVQASAFRDLSTLYRPVSWGLRITTDLSLMDSSGHVWVAHVPYYAAGNIPYYEAPTDESEISSMPTAVKYSLSELAEEPVVVSGRQFDSGSFRFRTPYETDEKTPTSVAVESSTGWCQIIVYVSNAPANSGSVNIEHLMHVEYLQDNNAAYNFVDAEPEPYDVASLESGSKIESAVPTGMIESAVATAGQALAVGERCAGIFSKAMPLIGSAMSIAGRLKQATGWYRAASSAPRSFIGGRPAGYTMVDV